MHIPKQHQKAFVIGHPIAHSRSPHIHNFWIKKHGLEAEYEAFDVSPEHLGHFVDRVKGGEFVGGNVTIPYKQAIMEHCDYLSTSARAIGAVNTLHVENGRLQGSNSDHFGFSDNLDQQVPGWERSLQTAIVLGAGGAARSVIYALLERKLEHVFVLNRTAEKAKKLAAFFGEHVTGASLDEFNNFAGLAGLLVNCSAVGMGGTRFENLDLDEMPKSALVNDIVYTPLETPLLSMASKYGLRTVDGLGMLLHQAIPGFEKWFDIRPEVTPELRSMLERTVMFPGLANRA